MNKQREIIHSVLETEIKRIKELEEKRDNIVFDLSYLKHPFFVKYEVKQRGSELGVFALEDIKAGEVASFFGKIA